MISSPYARHGELWRTFNKHFGPQGDPLILVARGATRDFNTTLPQRIIDRALAATPLPPAPNTSPNFAATSKGLSASRPSRPASRPASMSEPINAASPTPVSSIHLAAAPIVSRFASGT